MSQTNIQIVQKGYADFGRGDIPAVLSILDANVEWVIPGDVPDSEAYHGPTEVATFFQLVRDTWDFQAFEPRDFIAPGDAVVALGMYTATGRRTKKQITAEWAMLWRFRDGKVVYFREYTDTLAIHYGAGIGVAAA